MCAVILLVALAGCGFDPHAINKEPMLTPVGTGLQPTRVAMLATDPPVRTYNRDLSLWRDSSADLFRDPRAMNIGDVIRVKIQIKDKASIDSTTNRKRDSTRDLDINSAYDWKAYGIRAKGAGTFNTGIDSKTETKGEGNIERSESIELLVAAVVSDVLPNGNLVISGSQEVRVNYEVRVLSVAGVVRPRDIAADNSISYDKIAEARISYGGRGRITEVQQPGWGHQLFDMISPF
jgi:flagellar L-ring protein precursor FlgH